MTIRSTVDLAIRVPVAGPVRRSMRRRTAAVRRSRAYLGELARAAFSLELN